MILLALSDRLLGTRDNLIDACNELGLEVPDEKDLSVRQCANCSIWKGFRYFIVADDIPVCDFCTDMNLMRF
jgi:hypothetical protein